MLRNAEAIEDRPGGVGPVECVEMNTGNVIGDEILALVQRVLNPNLSNHLGIILARLEDTQKLRGKTGAASQISHAFQAADRCNGHDPGDNWDVNARQCAAFPKIEKIAIIEKQLSDNVISAGVDFGFEIIHLSQSIWRSRVSFWKTSNSDPETTAVRICRRFIKTANKFYQIDRVLE